MKLGFIGMGNMAYAILKGGHDAGFFAGSEVYAYDPNTDRLAQVAAETGIRPCCVADVLEVVVGLRSVYARFTDPQHVEVGTVEHQDVHGFSLFRMAVRRVRLHRGRVWPPVRSRQQIRGTSR